MGEKSQKLYVCSNCGAQFPKWNGRCLECGKWGTLNQEVVSTQRGEKKNLVKPAEILDLGKIEKEERPRFQTSISEVDRVFGGGLVPGSLTLLAGEPGIGKSTLVAQIADKLANLEKNIVYISGEESAYQISDRLERLGCSLKKIKFMGDTNLDRVLTGLSQEIPEVVVVDSIQTIYSDEHDSEAGGISQIRICAVKFLEWAKKNNVAVLIIGHITKDGQVAGPKTLEHIVDTVIYLERELSNNYSLLRAAKNRFGSLNEIGVFEMTGSGFQEVKNPSRVFLNQPGAQVSGSVISCIREGTRPFLVNVQSLVSKTLFGYPQRKASGIDINKLQILTSVISKRTKINLANQDVVVNLAGGLKARDPSLDLAICLAISSSLLNQIVNNDILVLGEVGLGGEIRGVVDLENRLKEAEKLGFKKAIIPDLKVKKSGLDLVKISKISQIIDFLKS